MYYITLFSFLSRFIRTSEKLLIIHRAAASDKLRTAARTDKGCLPDLLRRDAKRHHDRLYMHADEGPADVDPCVGACLKRLNRDRIETTTACSPWAASETNMGRG